MANIKNLLQACQSIKEELRRSVDLLVAELLRCEEEKREALDCLSAIHEYLDEIKTIISSNNITTLALDEAFKYQRRLLWQTSYLGYWIMALEEYIKNTLHYSNEKLMVFEDESEIFLQELEKLKVSLTNVYK